MTTTPNREQQMQVLLKSFKYLNRGMIALWYVGLGGLLNSAPQIFGRIMVLVHTGRKTGTTRYTPVNYTLLDGEIYCVSGFGSQSQWYRNIMVNPAAEIWLPDGWWSGEAQDITDHPNRVPILRDVLIASGFAAPLFEGLYPRQMTDAETERLFNDYDYRLIHIRRTHACTGHGGPGEYAWVWSLIALILALKLLFRRKE